MSSGDGALRRAMRRRRCRRRCLPPLQACLASNRNPAIHTPLDRPQGAARLCSRLENSKVALGFLLRTGSSARLFCLRVLPAHVNEDRRRGRASPGCRTYTCRGAAPAGGRCRRRARGTRLVRPTTAGYHLPSQHSCHFTRSQGSETGREVHFVQGLQGTGDKHDGNRGAGIRHGLKEAGW